MLTLVLILFVINVTAMLLQISVYRKRLLKYTFPLFWFLFVIVIHQHALKQNINFVTGIWESYHWAINFSALQIFETILGIFLSLYLLNLFNGGKRKLFWTVYELFPSLTVLAGVYLLEVWLFLTIESCDFMDITLTFSVIIFLIILIVPYILSKLVPEREIRNELRMILLVVQLLISMLYVIISNPLILPSDSMEFNSIPLMVFAAGFMLCVFAGFVLHRIKVSKFYQ